jgi:hypothetical protein
MKPVFISQMTFRSPEEEKTLRFFGFDYPDVAFKTNSRNFFCFASEMLENNGRFLRTNILPVDSDRFQAVK